MCRLAVYTLWGATPPPPELRGCAPELPIFLGLSVSLPALAPVHAVKLQSSL